jgi:hypothetical protein
MKQIIAATAFASLMVLPAAAQDEMDEGLSLMEQGAQLLLQGLMDEMGPTMSELKSLTEEMGTAMAQLGEQMGPALMDLMSKVDDIRNYVAPEFLPNGDIIIRRSPDAPLYVSDTESGEIDI